MGEHGGQNSLLENRIVEILDAIREVLNRLATLEEKTVWHNTALTQLNSGQKEMWDKITDHEKDRGRIALLEREIQYLSGDLSKQTKQVEVLSSIVGELQKSDSIQGKTVGFIESMGSQFVLTIVGAIAGAILMKLVGWI